MFIQQEQSLSLSICYTHFQDYLQSTSHQPHVSAQNRNPLSEIFQLFGNMTFKH